MWNETTRNWFVLFPAPPETHMLNRDRTILTRVGMVEFLRNVPWRGVWEILEDVLGIRATYLAGLMRRRIPRFSRWAWLKRLANIDSWQDFNEFNRRSEPPRFGMGPQ
jgi:hypothetical protein